MTSRLSSIASRQFLSAAAKRTPFNRQTASHQHPWRFGRPFASTISHVPLMEQSRAMSTTLGNAIDLPDGRHLGYHEFGDPNGTPVIYIHGAPDSGVTLSGFEDPLARQRGVRWIAPDRPGIGRSTFQPDRKILDYPSDLRCLIQHLGLTQYRILGTSGGTGYTLACAQQLPRKDLLALGICAGIGPWEAGLTGQSETFQQLMMLWRDQNAEFVKHLENIFLAAAQDPDPSHMETVWRAQLDGFQPEDREILMKPSAIQSAVRVFRQIYCQGGAGHGQEMKLMTEPWGFDVENIDYEGIKLWYGSADENTPPEMGRYMAERLPKSVYKEYPGETHYSIWREDLLSEFLKDLIQST